MNERERERLVWVWSGLGLVWVWVNLGLGPNWSHLGGLDPGSGSGSDLVWVTHATNVVERLVRVWSTWVWSGPNSGLVWVRPGSGLGRTSGSERTWVWASWNVVEREPGQRTSGSGSGSHNLILRECERECANVNVARNLQLVERELELEPGRTN